MTRWTARLAALALTAGIAAATLTSGTAAATPAARPAAGTTVTLAQFSSWAADRWAPLWDAGQQRDKALSLVMTPLGGTRADAYYAYGRTNATQAAQVTWFAAGKAAQKITCVAARTLNCLFKTPGAAWKPVNFIAAQARVYREFTDRLWLETLPARGRYTVSGSTATFTYNSRGYLYTGTMTFTADGMEREWTRTNPLNPAAGPYMLIKRVTVTPAAAIRYPAAYRP